MRRPMYYKLVGHTPKPITVKELSKQWDKDRTVAKTTIGPYLVSTVFLVLDHNYTLEGPPLLFETMVFFGPGIGVDDHMDHYMDRYSTWSEAERGHEQVCALVRVKHERDTAAGGHGQGAGHPSRHGGSTP